MFRNIFSYGNPTKQSPRKALRINRQKRDQMDKMFEEIKRLSEIVEKNGLGQQSNLRKWDNLTHVSNQDDLEVEISDDETIPFQGQDAESRDSLQNEFANQRKELENLESRLGARAISPAPNNRERIENEESDVNSKKHGLKQIKIRLTSSSFNEPTTI